jgi:hypothetical protein
MPPNKKEEDRTGEVRGQESGEDRIVVRMEER